MASTYSTDLRLELMADGENSTTWGSKTNTNWNMIEQAVAGVVSVAMTDAEYTLTTNNAASDEARNAVITMTGTLTASRNVIVPSVDKLYTIKNSTTGGFSIVVKTSAGTGITIANGATAQVYCDATNVLVAATAVGKITFTQPATGATFTLLDGKTLTVNNTLTLAGTDGTTMTFPATSASVARIDAAQTFVGTQTFSGLINANLGLTVAGAAFNSRGITDDATAKALTILSSGDIGIGTAAPYSANGRNLEIASATAARLWLNDTATKKFYLESALSSFSIIDGTAAASRFDIDTNGVTSFRTSGGLQVRITDTASSTRFITLTGSFGGNPTIGTSAGSLHISSQVGIGTPTTGIQLTVRAATDGTTGARVVNLGAAPSVDVFQTAVDVAAATSYFHYRAYQLLSSAPAVVFSIRGDGALTCGALTAGGAVTLTGQTVGTTVGAAGGASALPATPLGYLTTAINGTACKIPYYTA